MKRMWDVRRRRRGTDFICDVPMQAQSNSEFSLPPSPGQSATEKPPWSTSAKLMRTTRQRSCPCCAWVAQRHKILTCGLSGQAQSPSSLLSSVARTLLQLYRFVTFVVPLFHIKVGQSWSFIVPLKRNKVGLLSRL